VVDALPNPGPLTVLIDGRSVGTVTVTERFPLKLMGNFTPTAGLAPYRGVFELALNLAREFDEQVANHQACDDQLWNRLMLAYAQINRLGPAFAELPGPIEEFAIGPNWSVEITFAVQPASSADPWDS